MVHFFSYPYTSNEAKEKVLELASLLTGYCGRLTVNIVPFTGIQEELRRSCPEPYFTLAMRRFMMRISEVMRRPSGRWRSGYRRELGTGGQSDHGGDGSHRGCGEKTGVPVP